MSVKTNAMRQLDKARISYQMVDFLPLKEDEELSYDEISARTGVPKENIYKTILAVGHSGSYCVLVVPGEASVDLKKAAKVLGEKSIELADVRDLEKITGYVRGGCSPVGMKKQFRTVIDQTAGTKEYIMVSAGKRGFQLRLVPEDLISFVKGSVADICAGTD
ncbi:Cys-tRNA(Pro)/Cys-tRNA(Cys) deacylase YbaK [anaerobic digester metagenome]